MKGKKKFVLLLAAGLLWLQGCGPAPSPGQKQAHGAEPELVHERSMDLQYAENFTVDYYEGGYTLLTTTMDGIQFLIVPEGKETPGDVGKALGDAKGEQVMVLERPVKDIYLVDDR